MDISEFINKHKGKRALIIGLGESTNEILGEDLSGLITIGVNDVNAVIDPMYVLTVDTCKRLGKRADAIKNTRSQFVFTHISEWRDVPALADKIVNFKLGSRMLINLNNFGVLDFSNNSPYVAVILAYQMGCSEIGIIGVDFTDNHCHIKDGTHELVMNNRLGEINKDYKRLAKNLSDNGCKLYNLSTISKLVSISKDDLKKFISK